MTALMVDSQLSKSNRIKVQCEDDLFGRHWVLAVLDLKATTCYYLDSLRPSNVYLQFRQIVEAAMILYATQTRSNKRVNLNWINVLCPLRPGCTECGYYMLKFMKEIVEGGVEVLINKNIGGGRG
ncbi:hypothetical protein L1887_18194 [Cichorium endivia]|nr:hypothetical protein L1887_18194 [Cichorium endivia]